MRAKQAPRRWILNRPSQAPSFGDLWTAAKHREGPVPKRGGIIQREADGRNGDATTDGQIRTASSGQEVRAPRYLDGRVPVDSRAVRERFLSSSSIDDRYLLRLSELRDVARERDQSTAQLALSWVLRWPEVTSAIIGASSVAQLRENLKAATAPPLTDEQLVRIEQVLA